MGAIVVRPDGDLYMADGGNNVIRRITSEGTTNTFVGVKGDGRIVDGSKATARLANPRALSAGLGGQMVFADNDPVTKADVIRSVNAAGDVTTLSSTASFEWIRSMAVAADGSIYLLDYGALRHRAPDGSVTTIMARDALGGAMQYSTGLAVEASGSLLVSSLYGIYRVTLDGKATLVAGKDGQTGLVDGSGADARFTGAAGLAPDGKGGFYIADSQNASVRQMSAAGITTTVAGRPPQYGTVDGQGDSARFAGAGTLIAECSGNFLWSLDSVRRITPDGKVSTLTDALPTARSLAQDAAGNIYVSTDNEILKLAPDGTKTSLPYNASAMVAGAAGEIYFSDGSQVYRIGPNGSRTMLAGRPKTTYVSGGDYADGVGSAAAFSVITDMVLDKAGNIYVTDSGWSNKINFTNSGMVRKITPAGEVSTLAGKFGQHGLVDGKGSEARFFNPNSIDIDSAGNLYVADTGNMAIRKITADGTVSTLVGNGSSGFTAGPLTGRIPPPVSLAVSGNTMAVTTRQGVILLKGI
jgi:sugar lactone lactonase YvrE